MSKIMYGSQTYPWQMNVKRFAGDVPHMVKILKEAGFTGIEAEIVNMTKPALEFALELCDRAAEEDKSLLAEAAELVMSACRVSQHVIAAFASLSSDETYRYVTHRENEVFLAEREELYNKIIEKAKQ